MNAHQDLFPIPLMGRVLGVSTSGFYAWRRRVPSARRFKDLELIPLIQRIHTISKRTYGALQHHA